MEETVVINTGKLSQEERHQFHNLVTKAEGKFFGSPLEAFVFEEAEMRINDHLGKSPSDRGVTDIAAEQLYDYLINNDNAINYDGIDRIINYILKNEGESGDDKPEPDTDLDEYGLSEKLCFVLEENGWSLSGPSGRSYTLESGITPDISYICSISGRNDDEFIRNFRFHKDHRADDENLWDEKEQGYFIELQKKVPPDLSAVITEKLESLSEKLEAL